MDLPGRFVAPRHGFDHATLRALAAERLDCLSDGFATRPFTRGNVLWIPQQLWEPVHQSSGLWTVCIHSNTAPIELAEKMDSFLKVSAEQFVSFDDVLRNDAPSGLIWTERMIEWLATQRVRFNSTR